ncbi:hypothetical protein SLEP1_g7874 [Rubroshorea leprosula]|uniref:SWIM-type domain-containing protein n=1 Tax=Rubroshorea leprosula TaxID=152421 RepID=A0AAV5HZS4_9ROSI|nr:hypothetical protein SLEP1_g7874 [Rubroshorea leprosula]
MLLWGLLRCLILGEQAITTVREQTNIAAASSSRTVQEAGLTGDEFINVPWLIDNEDEECVDSEADEARRRRSQHKIFDDTFLILEFEIGMHEELHLEITISQARRAKQLIIKEFQGGCKKEYNKPIIGLDGAFLKGPTKGQLLSAVAKDPNNQMYSVAWAIVECERTDSWTWFLELLGVDLMIGDGENFTFLSDQQKYWCKAFLDTHCKCDAVDNNMSKTFNGFILDARQKAAMSLLEDLRWKCSKRIIANQAFVDKSFVGEFGPKFWEKIEQHRAAMSGCYMLPKALVEYEIKERNDSFLVNVCDHTCTCRVWQLNGIPCRHAMLSIQHREENFEDYVHPRYKRQAYINTYKHCIIPLDGMERWEETGMPPLDPPVERKTMGKPKKKMHLEDWEISNGSNISRKVEMPIGDARVVGGVQMKLQLKNQQVARENQLLAVDVQGQTSNVSSNLMGIQQANKGRKKDANNSVQCPLELLQEFRRKCQHKRKAKPIIKELVVESGSGTINIEVNEATSHGHQVHVQGKGKVVHGNKGKVVQTTKKAQRFARLRPMEQRRLDEMELANWSALIQAMGSTDDGNNCP